MIAREKALEELTAAPFDVVVIGGGVTGAGVALDAASRGYSVAIVERNDWAFGTSSRSSKMVHGGLRYLQNFDLGLVREALLERSLMVELAPHLVYPTPYLVPQLGEDRKDRLLGIGLNMYDVMATARVPSRRRGARPEQEAWAPDRHRTIPAEEVLELVPALEPRDPRSAYLFYDCQTDDVRLVLTILGEAERYGAVMANRLNVTGLIDRKGRAAGVLCQDAESGAEIEIEAANVVNATGVWADRIRPEEILDETEVPRIAPSRGTHVTVSADLLPLNGAACIVPAGSGRMIFALPWYGRALIGTTDNDYEGDIDRVQPGADDVTYILDAINAFFETSIERSRPDRGLRRRPAVDLDRRSEEVGRHLPQGRALRDVVGSSDYHRRQVDDLAEDGRGGRRPDRRARGSRSALPDRGDPARDGATARRRRPRRRGSC